jgi:hypothetical protein
MFWLSLLRGRRSLLWESSVHKVGSETQIERTRLELPVAATLSLGDFMWARFATSSSTSAWISDSRIPWMWIGWANLREDKMINPAPFFADFRPLGAHGGPREPWDGLGLERYCALHQKSAPEASSKACSWVLCACGAGRKQIQLRLRE